MGYIHDVQMINEQLYCIKDVQSINKYLILGKKKALLFDTGFGFSDFKPLIREITDLDYDVVDSHSDIDHCAGNYLFDDVYISIHDYKNLKIVDDGTYRKEQVGYRLRKHPALANEMDMDAYLQTSIYDTHYHFLEDGDSFDLGDCLYHVISIPGHTSGSICLWNPKNGWLFTGDSIMKYNVYYAQAQCEPMRVYYHSLQKIKKLQSKVTAIFPGHGEYGIPSHFITDEIRNVEEIASQKENDEFFEAAFGMNVFKHQYHDTLIYYSSEQLEELQRHGL